MIPNYYKYKKHILKDKRSKKFNFLVDNRNYYIYRVTNIISKQYYYGSRIQKLKDIYSDFWSYGTSSCEKKQILKNKNIYKVKIIKKFNNYNDCIIYESYLHQFFNVRCNPKFFNKSNQTPFDFIPDRRGMINCLTIDNIPCYITSKEYQSNKNKYKSYCSNKLLVLNKQTNKKISVTINEFYKNRNKYKTNFEGHSHTEKTKKKMSKSAKKRKIESGSKHIVIYDHNGVEQFKTFGNFKSVCITNKLPFTALKSSYQNNGSPIYLNSNNQFKNLANQKGWLMFFGWFAKIIN